MGGGKIIKTPVNLLIGPGSHGQLLFDQLGLSGLKISSYRYYPEYIKETYEGSKIVRAKRSTFFEITDKLIGNYFLRLRNDKQAYHEKLWNFYDQFVSRKISENDLLIAWPQISIRSMRKVKGHAPVLLEYPMIHPEAWQRKMTEEYKRLSINKGSAVFGNKIIEKMQEEINYADSINVLSSFAKKTFVDFGVDLKKISIVSPFADHYKFRIDESIQKREKFTFIYVGRIDVLKGSHLLLQAFSELSIPNSELLLVGHYNEEINSFMAKYGKNVTIMGFQNTAKLIRFYNSSHVFVLPSIQESFGMVCLEATLCGLPVVVSSNSVGTDLVSDLNGRIFNSGNLEDLKIAMKSVYDNYEQFDRVEIRTTTIKKYNKENYISAYLEMLGNFIDK